MQRREFMTLVGGAAASWPLAVRAQQLIRKPRIAVLLSSGASENQENLAVFAKAMQRLGWTDGENIQIDYRWTENDVARLQPLAKELINLQPDVVLAGTTQVVAAIQRETKTIPIVFVGVGEPVGSGFVESLAHPGGNITGFVNIEPSSVGKLIELLKDLLPAANRVVAMFSPNTEIIFSHLRPQFEAAAHSRELELVVASVKDDKDIERLISSLSESTTTGLIVTADPFLFEHRELIFSLATRDRIPTFCTFRAFVIAGGLISYGNKPIDQFEQAPTYIDRILKGADPADLPVQAPTEFELVINLKTANAIGIAVPPMLLARADEVIE
jgi:putative tryptophan/tyrosine transport system substrate-binding protein